MPTLWTLWSVNQILPSRLSLFFIDQFKSEKLQENETNPASVSDLWKPSKENREVRRKLRIARKLHELEEDIQSAANQVDISLDKKYLNFLCFKPFWLLY